LTLDIALPAKGDRTKLFVAAIYYKTRKYPTFFTQYTCAQNLPVEGDGQPDGTLVVITLAVPVESFSLNSSPFTSCTDKHSASHSNG